MNPEQNSVQNPTHKIPKRVEVAAAVITRPDGSFLLGQRGPDTFYPGYWEFPGGKLETGESAYQALVRELHEELGIEVRQAYPWLTREHLYEHAHVKLHFFEVTDWEGDIKSKVHSAFSWQAPGTYSNFEISPMLPANGPILKALCLPRIMGVTQASEIGIEQQLEQLDEALKRGLRLVQIREKNLPDKELEQFVEQAVMLCRQHDALVVVNHYLDLAKRHHADGLHLTSAQLHALSDRPDFQWVGASCHNHAELEKAAQLGLDYAVLGSVKETASHPGEARIGWGRFAQIVRDASIPVFGIGGLTPDDMLTAKQAGAHGIAAIRSIWQGLDGKQGRKTGQGAL